MRKLRLFMSAVMLAAFTFSVFAGPAMKKTMALSSGITTTGTVMLVIKSTDDFSDKDLGVVLHENEPDVGWNSAMASLIINHYDVDGTLVAKMAGYNSGWVVDNNFVAIEKGKQIALWLTVDVENDTYSASYQMEGETAVTELFTGYSSRESTSGTNSSTTVNFCSVTFNETFIAASSVEIIKDAEIVTAIEPYTFEGGSAIRQQVATANVTVAPTVVSDMLTLTSDKAIAQVAVMNLSGQQVITKQNVRKLNVSTLNSGVYFVKATTVDGAVAIQRIMKK